MQVSETPNTPGHYALGAPSNGPRFGRTPERVLGKKAKREAAMPLASVSCKTCRRFRTIARHFTLKPETLDLGEIRSRRHGATHPSLRGPEYLLLWVIPRQPEIAEVSEFRDSMDWLTLPKARLAPTSRP